jgi:tripartite-type tricarboxylate transporter receptor subunit TctC
MAKSMKAPYEVSTKTSKGEVMRTATRVSSFLFALVNLLFSATFQSAAAQESYPARPIKMIVPFPAGGVADLAGRFFAEALQVQLGQPVVIENRAGAGGRIGTEAIARAEPDGYTIGLGTISTLTANPVLYKTVRVDPLNDLTLISTISYAPAVVTVHPSFPARDFKAVVEELKKKPGVYISGSVGVGSATHLMIELMSAETNTKVLHVPYRGSAPALTAAISGETQISIDQYATAAEHIRSGSLIAIAVGGKTRLESLPNVPTLDELGLLKLGEIAAHWTGLVAPIGLPEAVFDRLWSASIAALRAPETVARFKKMNMDVLPSSPDELRERVARGTALHREVVQTLGLQLAN